jgi:hypothetical protein
MPEYIIVPLLSGVLGIAGILNRKIDRNERRMDALELKVAETYVTKRELADKFNLIISNLNRLEDKISNHFN